MLNHFVLTGGCSLTVIRLEWTLHWKYWIGTTIQPSDCSSGTLQVSTCVGGGQHGWLRVSACFREDWCLCWRGSVCVSERISVCDWGSACVSKRFCMCDWGWSVVSVWIFTGQCVCVCWWGSACMWLGVSACVTPHQWHPVRYHSHIWIPWWVLLGQLYYHGRYSGISCVRSVFSFGLDKHLVLRSVTWPMNVWLLPWRSVRMCVCTNMMSFIVLALFEAVSLYFVQVRRGLETWHG